VDPPLLDHEPGLDLLRREVTAGLSAIPPRIPSKYLYDQRGSELFDQICELDEYYPTRSETEILRERGDEIADLLGPGCMLVEYGSGSSLKTRLLLDRIHYPATYVPVDISREHLLASAASLRRRYPELEVAPVCADYTAPFSLPEAAPESSRRAVLFPGSTIGNLDPDEAARLIRGMAQVTGPGGQLMIGVDLHKDTAVLEAAYDDSAGVSAEFALNVLDRLRRELGAKFDRRRFRYVSRYDTDARRVEMCLESTEDQIVRIGEVALAFSAGARIVTEYSYKYSLEGFAEVAEQAGCRTRQVWTDRAGLYSFHCLEAG